MTKMVSFVTEDRILDAVRYLTTTGHIDDSIRDKFIRKIRKQMKDSRLGPDEPWPKLASYESIENTYELTEDLRISFSGWSSITGLHITLYFRNKNPRNLFKWRTKSEVVLPYDHVYDWEGQSKLIGIHSLKK